MKLTSKILIFAGAGALCLAFFSPVILFSKNNRRHPEVVTKILHSSAKCDTISLPAFSNIEVADWYYDIDPENLASPAINVIESSGISTPQLIADRSWLNQASFEVSDSTLNISFNYKSSDSQSATDTIIQIQPDNELIATILIPPHSLSSFNSGIVPLHLKGFSDSSLDLPPNARFTIDSCSFRSITFNKQ